MSKIQDIPICSKCRELLLSEEEETRGICDTCYEARREKPAALWDFRDELLCRDCQCVLLTDKERQEGICESCAGPVQPAISRKKKSSVYDLSKEEQEAVAQHNEQGMPGYSRDMEMQK